MMSTNVSAEETLTKVKELLTQAVNTYNSMVTSNKWHIRHTTHCGAACWICGDDNHGVGKCNKPEDGGSEATIGRKRDLALLMELLADTHEIGGDLGIVVKKTTGMALVESVM